MIPALHINGQCIKNTVGLLLNIKSLILKLAPIYLIVKAVCECSKSMFGGAVGGPERHPALAPDGGDVHYVAKLLSQHS